MPGRTFVDRSHAGRELGRRLERFRGERTVVLGLPRGGVIVAAEVAAALGAPLDVIIVRKLGVPIQPELAMGAIGEDGVRVVNDDIVRATRVRDDEIEHVERRERIELERRAAAYRAECPRVDLTGRVAIVVDDGIATGSTARAACQVARAHRAARIVLGAPVAPAGWEDRIGGDADELVGVVVTDAFSAIGEFYEHFDQTTDDEVVEALRRANAGTGRAGTSDA